MTVAIEITSHCIRYCRIEEGRIQALESFSIPLGSDPIETLATAPLPRPLGKVRVLMQHPEMLLQTMVQPACPPERLDRIVRFELHSLMPDVSNIISAWHIAFHGGEGDMRILVHIAKRQLVDRLSAALKLQGGTLAALTHPSVGLFCAWQLAHEGAHVGELMLADVGGTHTHVALVKDGELGFVRTHQGGMNDLVAQVAALRGIDLSEAARLVERLGSGSPQDLNDLIGRCAQGIASNITAVGRFAGAQLKLSALKPTHLALAGAGAQAPGFIAAINQRSSWKTTVVNPFAGISANPDPESLDALSALPSPWAGVIGGARASALPLDVLSQLREEKRAFWSTTGVLRAAAAALVAILTIGLVNQWFASQRAESNQATLAAPNTGLVPLAENAARDLDALVAEHQRLRERAQFLDKQRLPGRIGVELLNAVSQSVDPQLRRVQLARFQISTAVDGSIRVMMSGIADQSGQRSLGEILEDFRQRLREAYPPIRDITDLGSSIDSNRLLFQWELIINRPGATVPAAAAAATNNDGGSRSLRGGS